MTPFVRRLNLVALVLIFGLDLGAPANVVAAPVCVSRDEVGMAGAASMQLPGGVGGTGARTGGMGGTGAPLQQRPGGTGGTGAPIERPGGTGGTGIVGTITGFASICVNGQEVHYAKDVPVSENGAPASSAHLAIGQVVAVEAYGTQRGLQAGRIAILNVYEGPLTALPNASGSLRVMGQPVRLAAGARVAEGLRPGEPVRVSGLRDAAGEVVASRIERAPGLSEASAIGAIDHPGSLQGLKLGIPVAPAREMLVRGQWTGSQLEVAQTRPDPSLAFAGRGQTMVIEGLVQRTQARQLVVGGINVTLGQDTVVVGKQPASIALDQRVRVIGVFSATHELRASRVELDDDRAEHSGAGHSGANSVHVTSSSGSSGNSSQGERGTSSIRSESGDDHDGRSAGGGANDHGSMDVEDRSGKSVQVDTVEQRETSNSGSSDRVEKLEKLERVEKVEKVEKIEKVEKPEKVEKVEKVERPEKVDRVEKPEKVEKVEKVEKIERVEKPETVEKVEKVERPETAEKVEKVEHPERSGH
ncbi:DUF5666 domain-containing protein [Pseudomonas vlassakiae]|uniref:DUF5666 domain-containing protein n=1 Tax=Pseudomonas vlassakiae TaxID=485888 RepID=UPI0021C57F52|nr:DUF5666 domain-containing protein [Pseudomonas vlassakiae]MCU0124415.1 DUF5666 domain-containing protein [Pseudomonas vlassakiae]